MKKLILILLTSFFATKLFGPAEREIAIPKVEGINPYESLFKAICDVESNGNVFAYNSKENAVGIAQIRSCRIIHYNKLTGKNYSLNDCYDFDISKEVFMYFTQGRDLETIAKSWNGSGKKTIEYWNKVKAQL